MVTTEHNNEQKARFFGCHLGSQVESANIGPYILTGITQSEVEPDKIICISKSDDGVFIEDYIEDSTMLLRSLESITDEEEIELCNTAEAFTATNFVLALRYGHYYSLHWAKSVEATDYYK